jgi:hypothetical protein
VQRVTIGIGPEFSSIEQALAKTFLPTLFGDEYNEDDPHHALFDLLIIWAELTTTPDRTTLAQSNYSLKEVFFSALTF